MIKFEVNQNTNIEETTNKIKNKIDSAVSRALDITHIAKDQIVQKLEESDSVIEFANLVEYRLGLEVVGFSDEQVNKILSHENAHANKGQALGAGFWCYQLFVAKKDGKIFFRPATSLYSPIGWSEEKTRDTWREMIFAPEEYGDSLSEGDREDLDMLK